MPQDSTIKPVYTKFAALRDELKSAYYRKNDIAVPKHAGTKKSPKPSTKTSPAAVPDDIKTQV